MIIKSEVMPLINNVCPSFNKKWREYLAEKADEDKQLLFIDLTEFSRHLVNLFELGETTEFSAVFNLVERLHNEGDEYVKEAVSIGLLEDIQNNLLSRGIEFAAFYQFLGPESKKWWDRLNDFWVGKTNS